MKERAASGLHFLHLLQPVMASILPSDVLSTGSESEKVPRFNLRLLSFSLCFYTWKYPSLHSPSIRPSIHPSTHLSSSLLEVISLSSLIQDSPSPRSASSPFNLPLFLVSSFLFSASPPPSLYPSFSPHPSLCSTAAATATAAALWS